MTKRTAIFDRPGLPLPASRGAQRPQSRARRVGRVPALARGLRTGAGALCRGRRAGLRWRQRCARQSGRRVAAAGPLRRSGAALHDVAGDQRAAGRHAAHQPGPGQSRALRAGPRRLSRWRCRGSTGRSRSRVAPACRAKRRTGRRAGVVPCCCSGGTRMRGVPSTRPCRSTNGPACKARWSRRCSTSGRWNSTSARSRAPRRTSRARRRWAPASGCAAGPRPRPWRWATSRRAGSSGRGPPTASGAR